MISIFPQHGLSRQNGPLRSLLLIFFIATVLAFLLILWIYLTRIAEGRAPSDGIPPLYWEIPNAYLWILLFPLIYQIVRRNPLRNDTRISSLVVTHVFFAFLFAALHLVSNLLLSEMLFQSAGIPFENTNPWCPWTSSLRMIWRIVFYSLIVAVCYAVEFYDRMRTSKLKNSALEARIQATRLKQMKIRIDPAFVQRTLSDVSRLMQTNTMAAVETITRLGSFFRLIQKQEEKITLAEHVRLLRSYFRVETERSEGRIRATIRIDQDSAKIKIPDMQLQPLIHAFYRFRSVNAKDPYRLRVRILRKKGRILLILKDTLAPAVDHHQLIAELRNVLADSGFPRQRYRIHIRSHGVQISFEKRSGKTSRLTSPALHISREKMHSHYKLWIALSAIVVVYFLARRLLVFYSAGNRFTPQEILPWSSGLLLCGISVPLILWLAVKIRLRSIASFFLHCIFSILVAFCFITAEVFLRSPETFVISWTHLFLNTGNIIRFPDQILVYWGVLLLANAFWNFKSYGYEQIRSARLQSDLSGAQLKALEMQLHPHFLFNTLHAINGLILTNQAVAARMLKRLQHFLHMTLRSTDQHLVPFNQELKFLECYLEIQKIRFGNRLNVKMEIEPETLSLPVPQLILQPIVENAIRHGLSRSVFAGEILLQAKRQNGCLTIAVQDNGPGLAVSNVDSEQRKGVGLQNTALRLYHLYGNSHHFSYGNRSEGGFEVKMEIPHTA